MATAPKLTKIERYKLRELAFLRRELQIYIAAIDKIENIVAISIVGVSTALLWRFEINDPIRKLVVFIPLFIWFFYFLKYLALSRNIKLNDWYVMSIERLMMKNQKGWVQSYHDLEFQRQALARRWDGWPEWIKANLLRKVKMRVPRYLYWVLTFICAVAIPIIDAWLPMGRSH